MGKPEVIVIKVLHLYFTRVAIVSLAENNSWGQCYKGFTLVFYKSSYCLPC